jgi:hypothetical protein
MINAKDQMVKNFERNFIFQKYNCKKSEIQKFWFEDFKLPRRVDAC